jgi:hypothetical protein
VCVAGLGSKAAEAALFPRHPGPQHERPAGICFPPFCGNAIHDQEVPEKKRNWSGVAHLVERLRCSSTTKTREGLCAAKCVYRRLTATPFVS